MSIDKLIIGGFANIEQVTLDLKKFNALVALNNFGKSNVIKAIAFGLDFIKASSRIKNEMMAFKPAIPINKKIDNLPFRFEVEFKAPFQNLEHTIRYEFSFDWIKNDKSKGQRITSERLKIKPHQPEAKFRMLVNRDLQEALYLPSPLGRCDKKLSVQKNELAIGKLGNFDELFYLPVLNAISDLGLVQVDTLQNPDRLFSRYGAEVVQTDYSLNVPEEHNVGFFIYSLKKIRTDLFEMLKDVIVSLLPEIEYFEPEEIDLKTVTGIKGKKSALPLDFPEKLYDIRVKEKNNNQHTSISGISSGSQKLLYVLSLTLAAEINNIPLVSFEELENSIHPGLLQRLLVILDGLNERTKIIVTGHSPYLVQYFDNEKIKIGLPNKAGLARFSEIKKSKYKRLLSMAEAEGVSVGDFIFDQMIDSVNGESDVLNQLTK